MNTYLFLFGCTIEDLSQLKKIGVIIVVWICLISSSCSHNSIESIPEEQIDSISGVYYLRGPQTHSGWHCNHCLIVDPYINYTEFSVNVKLVPDKVDTVRIYGLEGADAGIAEKKVFPSCTSPDGCPVYARLKPSGEVEVDIEHNGRMYQATGFMYPTTISLTAYYSYEDVSVDYDLSGERVITGMDKTD